MEARKTLGEALHEIIEAARSGGPVTRIGLMSTGSEHGPAELLRGAMAAMAADPRLQVVMIGPRTTDAKNTEIEWIETEDDECAIAYALEEAISTNRVSGAVAMHYPFPAGVATFGRVVTPARGKPMIVASTTGTVSTNRVEAMVLNAVLGAAVAKSTGITNPSIGILNLDGAQAAYRALLKLKDAGYPINFAVSNRADGGSILRGNDILCGAADVCVTDTLTGNVLMKMFSAFTTGGSYESTGWGYGPSAGANWTRVISIISRASGSPVIGNALSYTAQAIRGALPHLVSAELNAAKHAGLDTLLSTLSTPKTTAPDIKSPPEEPTSDEIHGVDVLSIEDATRELWKNGIYAQAAMGCTGPVVKIPSRHTQAASRILETAGYI